MNDPGQTVVQVYLGISIVYISPLGRTIDNCFVSNPQMEPAGYGDCNPEHNWDCFGGNEE